MEDVNKRGRICLLFDHGYFLRNSTPGDFGYVWQSKQVGIIALKFRKTRNHFLNSVCRRRRRRGISNYLKWDSWPWRNKRLIIARFQLLRPYAFRRPCVCLWSPSVREIGKQHLRGIFSYNPVVFFFSYSFFLLNRNSQDCGRKRWKVRVRLWWLSFCVFRAVSG